jgi:hypothetical protein
MGKPKQKKKTGNRAVRKPLVLTRKEKRKEQRKLEKQAKQKHYLARFGKVSQAEELKETVAKNPNPPKSPQDKLQERELLKKKKETKLKKEQVDHFYAMLSNSCLG